MHFSIACKARGGVSESISGSASGEVCSSFSFTLLLFNVLELLSQVRGNPVTLLLNWIKVKTDIADHMEQFQLKRLGIFNHFQEFFGLF